MVMFGQKLTGRLPFKEVYLHAMVRDAYGRKMSKSLGNIIDPLDVITGISLPDLMGRLDEYNLDPKELEKAKKGQKEMYPDGIPECGTDAMRFALCAYTLQGRDINLDVLRMQGYRHFCNKLWNATKFAMRNFTSEFVPRSNLKELSGQETPMDLWILSRLSVAADLCDEAFKSYEFPKATTALYNFWLYELCDVYLESLKPIFQGDNEKQKVCAQNVLYACLDAGLRMLSPFMPYVTEELYQRLPHNKEICPESICVASYPKDWNLRNESIENQIDHMMEIVKTIRSKKDEYMNNKAKCLVYVRPNQPYSKEVVGKLDDVIRTLSQSSEIKLLGKNEEAPGGCAIQLVGDKCEVLLSLKGMVDFTKEIQKLRLKKEKSEESVGKLVETTKKDDYETKVPEKVREQNQQKISQLHTEIEKLKITIDTFEQAAKDAS